MATYSVHAVNLSTFALGETDKIVTMFSAERGLIRAVAKGSRKPGAKIGGRSEPLNINRLLIASGRNLDIITQAETIGSFPRLRNDLTRLSYALYFVELTQSFAQGLNEDSALFFDYLCHSLSLMADSEEEPVLISLKFELNLLKQMGYQPELSVCLACSDLLSESSLSIFHHQQGGIICTDCYRGKNQSSVQEHFAFEYGEDAPNNKVLQSRKHNPYAKHTVTHITPLVWSRLLLLSAEGTNLQSSAVVSPVIDQANQAAHRLIQTYIEYRSGRRMKALDLIEHF